MSLRRAPVTGVPRGRVCTGAVVHVDRSHLVACVPAAAAATAAAVAIRAPPQPVGEFYAVPEDEWEQLCSENYEDPITQFPPPAGCNEQHPKATFRIPLPKPDPNTLKYKYRVYDAAELWRWVKDPRHMADPIDPSNKLLQSDWELLRDRYSNSDDHPTPLANLFRTPIYPSHRWPPGPPGPLTNASIIDAITVAVRAGAPSYVHFEYGPIADWDVSGVTNMRFLFFGTDFNGDLSRWDVSNVTTMDSMFWWAHAFNGNLSGWDVSNVRDMDDMFKGATSFNGDLSNWDVSNVKKMDHMFYEAIAFNGDLSGWDVSADTSMYRMFWGATASNRDLQPRPPLGDATIREAIILVLEAGGPDYVHPDYGPIADWNVSKVTDMREVFRWADGFNGDLSGWDVSNVTDMQFMFWGAIDFNGDLSGWDVSNVTNMRQMFGGASVFNGDLSGWDVSNVTDMEHMFWHATKFNGDLSRWDVRKVRNMEAMFYAAEAFNGDLSGWDVGNYTNMAQMFMRATTYNQNQRKRPMRPWERQQQRNVQRRTTNAALAAATWDTQRLKI